MPANQDHRRAHTNFFSIQGKSTIIELSSGPTQFHSESVKPYHNPIIEMNENPDKDVEDTSGYQDIIPRHTSPDTPTALVPSPPLESSTTPSILTPTLSTPVKRGRGRPRKYPIQANLLTSSDICFVMDNLN